VRGDLKEGEQGEWIQGGGNRVSRDWGKKRKGRCREIAERVSNGGGS
jgi:hypothetical protein